MSLAVLRRLLQYHSRFLDAVDGTSRSPLGLAAPRPADSSTFSEALKRPFYGPLLAPTLVLAAYGTTHVSPDHLWRPLGVLTFAAAMALGWIGGATRRWHASSFAVALLLLAMFGLAPLFGLLVAAWTFVAWRSVKAGHGWGVTPRFTTALNVVSLAWCGLASATSLVVSLPHSFPAAEPVSVEPGPNVYLILLDAYPRHDTLMEYFAFDNRPFLDELEKRDFDVAEDSRSQYPGTVQTVPTMLHARPLEELLVEAWTGSDAQYRQMWDALNAAPIPTAFEAAGYTTYAIVGQPLAHDWRTADVTLESPWLTTFEESLIGRGILGPYFPWDANVRARLLDDFAHLKESAGTSPRFVFAHIMSPHSPYVFDAEGEPALPCPPAFCENHGGPPNPTLGRVLVGQILFTNHLVIDAIDHIVAVDPDATVIVFSDHGLRRDRADMDEWFRTLFAARNATFPDDVTLLDVFPTLLSHRVGAH